MHDGAATGGRIDEGDVFWNSVVGLHFETPPVRPHRRANPFLGEQVSDFVGLDGVVEGGDVVTKLVRHIEHGSHLVGAIAVHVNDDVALQRGGQGIEPQVALRRLRVLGVFAAGGQLLLVLLLSCRYSCASAHCAR